MKTIFRLSGLAVVLSAVIGFSAAQAAAQNPCEDADGITAADAKIRENYPKLETLDVAITAGKEFLEKYGECEATKAFVDWLKPQLPVWETKYAGYITRKEMGPRFARFDAGVKASNADEVYAAGKEILAKQPDNINVLVAMGLVGANQSTLANSYKYTEDGLKYANMALAKVKGGEKFNKKNDKGEETAGIFWTERTRPELISDLTYSVAYLNYFGKKDKATALPVFYELAQGSYKDNPFLFSIIGDYYVEQRKPIAEQIRLKIEEQKKEGEDTAIKEAREEEIKKLVAVFNGYNERILDAYGRAYKVTKDTPANKAYRDNLFKIMQDVYKQRFDKDTGLNEYITAAVAKPFPNPTSEVTPVSDPEPAKTTGSTGPATTATPPVAAQPTAAKVTSTTKGTNGNGKATAAATKPKR